MNRNCPRALRRPASANAWLCVALLGLSASCAQYPSAAGSSVPDQVRFDGRVVRVELEGGFWGLIADDGSRYDPRSLPARFQEHGMRVRVAVQPLDLASVHMWGTPVRIVTIEALP